MSQVLLRNLQLGHYGRFFHSSEKWTKRFARLKVDWPVLRLDNNVVAEFAVERHKLFVSLLGSVFTLGTVNKSSPHYNSAVRFYGVGKHVCAVGVRAPEVLRSRLTFAVRFNQESPEVGNHRINFLSFIFPPLNNFRIERIGRF